MGNEKFGDQNPSSPAEPEFASRWRRVASLPLPSGVGDLDHGLCAVARIVYAATGKVTDDLACVSQIARRMLIAANDWLPEDLRQELGTEEIRDALLATTPADDDRLRWVVAEQARQSAIRALGYAGATGPEVNALRACEPIADAATAGKAARAAADAAAAYAAYADAAAAYAYAYAYADAADAAAYAYAYAYADAYADAAAYAYVYAYADAAADAARVANEYRHRIDDVRALLGLAPSKAVRL